jgi:hypothetical protein
MMEKSTDHLTRILYATGPKEYANVLVTRINSDAGPSTTTLGYFGLGVNWGNLLPRTLEKVYGDREDVRIILEDAEGFVSADCKIDGCVDLTDIVRPIKVNGSYDSPLQITKLKFGNYKQQDSTLNSSELVQDSLQMDPLGLPSPDPEVLKGWDIHLFYEHQSQSAYVLPASLFGLSLASFGLLIFYYLVPRYWLDDTEQIRNGKSIDHK